MRKLFSALFLFLFLFAAPCMAADVSLAWDASVTATVTGYKVYFGNESRTYQRPIIIGNQTMYTVTGLQDGTWYFAVTAFDAYGNESGFSNEVSTVVITIEAPANLIRITE
jgi:fibronectin type 3 domain-containing protein